MKEGVVVEQDHARLMQLAGDLARQLGAISTGVLAGDVDRVIQALFQASPVLEEMTNEAVTVARRGGATWDQLGLLSGRTRATMHQRFGPITDGRPRRASGHARLKAHTDDGF
jgi:hypothetical protein